MAFLEVITRTFGQRPDMLRRCTESLQEMHDSDWTQQIVVDQVGLGVNWANANLATVDVSGTWVWILDDDDICVRPSLVDELKTIHLQAQPDVIMVRAWHAKFGWLPDNAHWEHEPVCGKVGASSYLVKKDLWMLQRHRWRSVYEADYWFIHDLWEMSDLRWYWHDVTAAYYPQQSMGAPEHAH